MAMLRAGADDLPLAALRRWLGGWLSNCLFTHSVCKPPDQRVLRFTSAETVSQRTGSH